MRPCVSFEDRGSAQHSVARVPHNTRRVSRNTQRHKIANLLLAETYRSELPLDTEIERNVALRLANKHAFRGIEKVVRSTSEDLHQYPEKLRGPNPNES